MRNVGKTANPPNVRFNFGGIILLNHLSVLEQQTSHQQVHIERHKKRVVGWWGFGVCFGLGYFGGILGREG